MILNSKREPQEAYENESDNDNYYGHEDASSPFLPRRISMLEDYKAGSAADGGIGGSNGSSNLHPPHASTSPFSINVDSVSQQRNLQQNGPSDESSRQVSAREGYTTGVIKMNVQERDGDNIQLRRHDLD